MSLSRAFDRYTLSKKDTKLAETVMQGRPIFLSLEKPFGMPADLYAARAHKAATNPKETQLQKMLQGLRHPITGHPTHHRYNIDSVNDALWAIKIIRHYGRDEYFETVRVTYQGWVIPYHDFHRRSPESQKNLFHHLHYAAMMRDFAYCVKNDKVKIAFGIPRLLRFNPSNMTRHHPNMVKHSANPIAIQKETTLKLDKIILMRHRLDIADGLGLDDALLSRSVYILATPWVNATEVNKIYGRSDYTKNKHLKAFVQVNWHIESYEQITPAKGHIAPRAVKTQQPRLI